uniref:Uncharacterized protein n=1 Tax=Anguilla anguilla TaxID=7936 RepID=A0A0E9WKC2_ANGAN
MYNNVYVKNKIYCKVCPLNDCISQLEIIAGVLPVYLKQFPACKIIVYSPIYPPCYNVHE